MDNLKNTRIQTLTNARKGIAQGISTALKSPVRTLNRVFTGQKSGASAPKQTQAPVAPKQNSVSATPANIQHHLSELPLPRYIKDNDAQTVAFIGTEPSRGKQDTTQDKYQHISLLDSDAFSVNEKRIGKVIHNLHQTAPEARKAEIELLSQTNSPKVASLVLETLHNFGLKDLLSEAQHNRLLEKSVHQ